MAVQIRLKKKIVAVLDMVSQQAVEHAVDIASKQMNEERKSVTKYGVLKQKEDGDIEEIISTSSCSEEEAKENNSNHKPPRLKTLSLRHV